jgi:FG-GAP-like repeat
MHHHSALLLLVLLLAATPERVVPLLAGGQAAQPAAVQTPTLKWAYGGCFTSFCQTGWYASPAVADLDGDTQAEVIWGAYDVVSLDGATGNLEWRAANSSRVWPGIAVADLTGDGPLEVIVGRGSDQVTAYSSAGATLWSRNPFGGGEVRTLAVDDLDGDGPIEVIVGRASGGETRQLHVFEANGSPRAGWPARRNGEAGYGWGMYNQNVAVGDLNNDGTKEIIGPTDTHYITALDRNGNQLPASPIYGAGKVWSQVGVHVDQAADLRGYANCGSEHRPNFANSAPVISDLNGDGAREIIVVGDVYNCGIGDPDGDMYQMPWILKADRTRWAAGAFDWTTIPADPGTRPLSQDFDVIQNAVMNAVPADLDGDGVKEILFPSYDGQLHAYRLDKTRPGNWPFDVPGSGIRFASEPAVVDLDNDGQAEVIITSWPENGGGRNGQLHILDYNGNQIHAVDLPAPRGDDWNGGLGAPTVANIDGDADLEVVVGTVASGVVAYDLPGSAGAQILWGTGRGSLKRTGVAALEQGITLNVTPAARAIDAAGATTFSVVISGEPAGQSVTLSAGASPAGPLIDISTPTVTLPATVTMTVTDQHPAGPLTPGVAYTIELQAQAGSVTRTASVTVLVGGERVALPFIAR